MALPNKLKRSWKNDLRLSVAEHDVLKLRNQLKAIQRSPELRMSDYRWKKQVRENNLK